MDTLQKPVIKKMYFAPKEIKPPKASDLHLPPKFAKSQHQHEFMEQLNKWFKK